MTPNGAWPPRFTLDQERILDLLTGDRFYSDPGAALREAILNAIDAIQRRRLHEPQLTPQLSVGLNRDSLAVSVTDNGTGMSQADVTALFTKVGASAANLETHSAAVGEFGIGVVSYFMAADTFELQTFDGESSAIGLGFSKSMLAGGTASEMTPSLDTRGTSVTLHIRNPETFQLLLKSLPHWCRDVEGLSAVLSPDGITVAQGGHDRRGGHVEVPHPEWVERSHLGPVSEPGGWDAMTGISRVAVLYRGVFVQEFDVRGPWGIEGSIDVDPKHFKPRLNREGFISGQFQAEVHQFLQGSHPLILHAMASRLAKAVGEGVLDGWDVKRWATLWLSVPRTPEYTEAVSAWDAVFRSIPAFQVADGNNWRAASLSDIKGLPGEMFLAPLAEEQTNDVIKAAIHLLRNTGRSVIRGVRRDKTWMRFAPAAYGTTADLIASVFSQELPPVVPISSHCERILSEVPRTAPLFTGPPSVDLVQLGRDSAPALRLRDRLVLNTDNPKGAAIARDALDENRGAASLIELTARHAHEQLSEVAAAVRQIAVPPEILSPVRRRFIAGFLP